MVDANLSQSRLVAPTVASQHNSAVGDSRLREEDNDNDSGDDDDDENDASNGRPLDWCYPSNHTFRRSSNSSSSSSSSHLATNPKKSFKNPKNQQRAIVQSPHEVAAWQVNGSKMRQASRNSLVEASNQYKARMANGELATVGVAPVFKQTRYAALEFRRYWSAPAFSFVRYGLCVKDTRREV